MAPSLCIMSGDFFLPDGRPLYRLSLQIQLTYEYGDVNQGGSLGSQVTYYTDVAGHVDIPLAQGVNYAIRLGTCPDARSYITAPEESLANLFDYLFPYITEVKLAETSYELGVGETTYLSAVAVFSDDTEETVGSATFESSDESIASVSGGNLTGVLAGSTTVNISEVDDSYLPVREDILESPFLRLLIPYVIGPASGVDVT